jgi:hypothetical protein
MRFNFLNSPQVILPKYCKIQLYFNQIKKLPAIAKVGALNVPIRTFHAGSITVQIPIDNRRSLVTYRAFN